MYFSKLVTFAFAASSATAAVIKRDARVEKRDLATFQTAFANISTALTNFDTAINALQATDNIPTAVTTITGYAHAFDDALIAGSTNINASSTLGIFDALGLVSLVNNLVTQANTTLNDLIAKEPIINSAGYDPTVVSELLVSKLDSYSFIGACVTHIPAAEQGLAQTLAGQVIDIINRGIVAFGGTV